METGGCSSVYMLNDSAEMASQNAVQYTIISTLVVSLSYLNSQ